MTLPAASNGNTPLTYSLAGSLPAGMSFTASTRVLSGTPTATQNAATYTYKVEDANGDEASDSCTIAVEDDSTPSLGSTSDQTWVKDSAVNLTLPAASNGNTPLTYSLAGSLPTGVSFNASTRVLSGTPTATQNATTYTYKVEDRQRRRSASDSFTITVEDDSTPSLGQHLGPDLGQGQRRQPDAAGGQQRQHAADLHAGRQPADGGELQRLHAGAVGHADGDAERHHLHLQGRGPQRRRGQRQLHDHGRGRLDALAWAAPADQTWVKDSAVSLTLPAASNGNTPLTYTLAGSLPTGVSFNASTRVLSGTPTATQNAATYTYKVEDANGDEASDSFTIAVEEDSSPTLSATADQAWVTDSAVTLTLPAASNGNSPLTYTLAGSLPTGVTFTADTRVLTGTPTATQTAVSYTYKVRDRNGDEATDIFTIAVAADGSPSLTETSDQSWIKGIAVSLTLPTATSGNEPLTYTLTGSLPTGVNYNTSTRVVSGTPSAVKSTTTYTYKVRDKDGDEDSDTFTIIADDTEPSHGDQRPELDQGVGGLADAASPAAATRRWVKGSLGVSFNTSTRVV